MRFFSVLTLVFAVAGCGGGDKAPLFDESAVISELKTWDAVKDAASGFDARQINVGVLDNGQDRTGYAMSVCELAREHKLRSGVVYVRVLDIAKLVRDERVELGKYRCEL